MSKSKVFMPEASLMERINVMRDTADGIEEGGYVRELTDEEITNRNEELVQVCIDLKRKNDEKKDWMDSWKSEVKPMTIRQDTLITELKTRQIEMDGKLFLMANHDNGMMEYYDEQGELVRSRRLKPEEKRGNVFRPAKTGTND